LVRYDYTDANGCANSITKEVEITPANAFTPVDEELDICPQPQYWIEALTMAEEEAFKASGVTPVYYWKHITTSLRAISIRDKSEEGEYEVTVRDQAGCPIAQKTFAVKVDCEPKLFIPTAFTPNTDGKNEILKIFGEDFIKLDFRVYNRWGEVVFTARSKEETWDGMIKGQPAPAGVYAWTATFENTLKRGEVVRKQGQIMLIR
jgi:gliding motility-associated-like protein